LWHIDIKGPFFIQLERHRYLKTWIYGLVDDHSRYVLGLHVATGREIAPILAWLRRCIELCGRPIDLMTDNGVEFAHWMPGLLNRFGKTLRELEIRQIRTQIDSPWTNGKIESFWATLKGEVLDREVFRSLADAEVALERFARYYNYHRLHGRDGARGALARRGARDVRGARRARPRRAEEERRSDPFFRPRRDRELERRRLSRSARIRGVRHRLRRSALCGRRSDGSHARAPESPPRARTERDRRRARPAQASTRAAGVRAALPDEAHR